MAEGQAEAMRAGDGRGGQAGSEPRALEQHQLLCLDVRLGPGSLAALALAKGPSDS